MIVAPAFKPGDHRPEDIGLFSFFLVAESRRGRLRPLAAETRRQTRV